MISILEGKEIAPCTWSFPIRLSLGWYQASQSSRGLDRGSDSRSEDDAQTAASCETAEETGPTPDA